jgi:CHAT domain-containing protein/Tfp pilus assembly protein PilF
LAARRSEPEVARKYFEEALDMRERAAPESLAVAASLNHVSLAARDAGDRARFEQCLRRALAIRQKLAPNAAETADSLQNLAVFYHEKGDLREAEQYYGESERVYRLALAPGDRRLASVLNSKGILLTSRGDLSAAEDHLLAALELRRKFMPDSLDVANTLKALGELAARRFDTVSAERYLTEAESITARRVPGTAVHAGALASLAEVLRLAGKADEAEIQFRAVNGIAANRNVRTPLAGSGWAGLGRIALSRGDWSAAQKNFEKALSVLDEISPVRLDSAVLAIELGRAMEQGGDLDGAAKAYLRGIGITGDLAPASLAHAKGLHAFAGFERKKGNLAEATRLLARATESLDRTGANVGGGLEVRSSFRSRSHDIYRDYMDRLLQDSNVELAFHVLERARARVMIEMLAERDLVLTTDLRPELDQERRRLAARYDRVYMQLRDSAAGRKSQELTDELAKITAEREKLADSIRRSAPAAAALAYPEPFTADEVRQNLDPGTVLISYSVGPTNTVVFVVAADGTAKVSATVLDIGEERLSRLVSEYRDALLKPDSAASRRSGASLYQKLLHPIETQIRPAKRLLIIPDGPLHELPFVCLKRPDSTYLIEWKPLHVSISATIYSQLRRRHVNRTATAARLAAFGDPLPWVKGSTTAFDKRPAGTRGLTLGALPSSRREVQTIAALSRRGAVVFTGSEASEQRARRAEAQVMHFAIHAFADPERPLDSALVFSPPMKTGPSDMNGLLQAWELIEQVRWNADLVVLSACQTALGKQVHGEGILGLTRAIHHTGVPSVISTLWKVEDARSADLMIQFHRYLNGGLATDEALRRAQLDLIRSELGSAPAHWAAFVLSGDWAGPARRGSREANGVIQ